MKPFNQIPCFEKDIQIARSKRFQADALEYLLDLDEQHGPIVRYKALHWNVVQITDPVLVREVLVTRAKKFTKNRGTLRSLIRVLGDGLLTSIDEKWQRQRKLAQPAFHSRRINSYADTMSTYTDLMSQAWPLGESFDVSDAMMALTMRIISKTMFDIDMEELGGEYAETGQAIDDLQEIVDEAGLSPFLLPRWVPTRFNRNANRVNKILNDSIDGMIQTRRAESTQGKSLDRGDLLSMLLLSEDENGDRLSDEELREQLITIFSAGHETTANALSWSWYLISQHPKVQEKFHAEIDALPADRLPSLADMPNLAYTEMILKETLRLYPTAWTTAYRRSAEDTELGGYEIKKGTLVGVSPYVLQRSSRNFDRPHAFIPERFTPENRAKIAKYSYLPFSTGPRVCIGNSFAMMEGILILATVGRRLTLSLDPAQEILPRARITLANSDGMRMLAAERMSKAVRV